MNRVLLMGRRTWAWLTALALWFLTSPVVVWAQEGRSRGDLPGDGKSYVNQYALLILLVAVALFAICRPSRRETEIKAQH